MYSAALSGRHLLNCTTGVGGRLWLWVSWCGEIEDRVALEDPVDVDQGPRPRLLHLHVCDQLIQAGGAGRSLRTIHLTELTRVGLFERHFESEDVQVVAVVVGGHLDGLLPPVVEVHLELLQRSHDNVHLHNRALTLHTIDVVEGDRFVARLADDKLAPPGQQRLALTQLIAPVGTEYDSKAVELRVLRADIDVDLALGGLQRLHGLAPVLDQPAVAHVLQLSQTVTAFRKLFGDELECLDGSHTALAEELTAAKELTTPKAKHQARNK
mmetsp:Transcript_35161/g.87305  ORF Transcript_35161/g.87305 Transcript_35161/m.87305 type:complete len:269 (+) Transcript_35161:1856-2662(+)